MAAFVWFVITLIVTLSNIILGIFIYYELAFLRIKNRKIKELREVCMYYVVGMMLALICTIILFGLTVPVL